VQILKKGTAMWKALQKFFKDILESRVCVSSPVSLGFCIFSRSM